MNRPLVSVIMNCLDGEPFLRKAIESVFAQTIEDWEIVFWDNASTDRTPKIAQEYEPKLRYFRSEETVPLYAARNLALEQCRGRYIAFLDCDDLWLAEKLEAQLPLLEENSQLGFVYSDSFFSFEEGGQYRNFEVNEPARGMIFQTLLSRYFLHIQTVMVPSRIFDELDEAFDDTLQLTGDKDLFLRIAHDFPVDYIDRPLVKWRFHGNNWSTTHRELFPREQRHILSKLRQKFPDIDREYSEAVRAFEAQIARSEALQVWEKRGGRQARRRMRGHIGSNLKNLIVYVASFLPHGFLRVLRRMREKIRKIRSTY